MQSVSLRAVLSLCLLLPSVHAFVFHTVSPLSTTNLASPLRLCRPLLQDRLHTPTSHSSLPFVEGARQNPRLRRRLERQTLSMTETSQAIATGVGFLLGAGSVLLYTPMIYRIFRRQSAQGLAPSTWLLKLSCYSASNFYNISKGYPISSYAEMITLWLQASVMISAVCYYQKKWWPLAATAAATGAAALAVSSTDAAQMQDVVLPSAQVFASLSGSGAIVPQLWENYRRGGSGEFSPVTAALLATGNALRAWTTSELTGDPLLLAGFGLGFSANLSILVQILYYGITKEGRSLPEIMLSDVVDPKSRAKGDGEDAEAEARLGELVVKGDVGDAAGEQRRRGATAGEEVGSVLEKQ